MQFSKIFREFRIPRTGDIKRVFFSLSKKELIMIGTLTVIFIVSFIIFFHKLNNRYLVEIPTYGGTLSEGIIGTPRFINPILAISDADKDLTALVYSGLMKKDTDGEIIPNLAESYTISDDGLTYTFTLKSNIYFHDGMPVTADDVIYTINKIKDPALKSPKHLNWEGVTIEKISDTEVSFSLKQPYIAFLENSTLGILPYHIWKDLTTDEFGFSDLNTNGIGSGPYMIKSITKKSSGVPSSYNLASFKKYVGGRPFESTIVFKFYPNEKELVRALENKDINQASTITPENAEGLKKGGNIIKTSVLPRIFGLFFNQNQASIFTDKQIIKAFNLAIDKKEIVENVLSGYGVTISSPVPSSITNEKDAQEQIVSIEQANIILDKAGWSLGTDGIREKKINKQTVKLAFSIATGDTSELKSAVDLIALDLKKIGVAADVKIYDISALNQNVIRTRKYDALFFGEIINHESDLYAFWHSSQRNDPGLNIALYTNTKVDKLLETALTTTDQDERIKKYIQFENEIEKDQPAVFIYSPNFIYAIAPNLEGFSPNQITVPSDRFNGIEYWHTETEKIWKIFAPKN
ncbi:MAG: ABC transporter substrate-binding protein [Candidatus Paceibacterota bacterium]|jgi:peptide/nickel transport system substrate-binding protein